MDDLRRTTEWREKKLKEEREFIHENMEVKG
jgi:hypothetical protein